MSWAATGVETPPGKATVAKPAARSAECWASGHWGQPMPFCAIQYAVVTERTHSGIDCQGGAPGLVHRRTVMKIVASPAGDGNRMSGRENV